MEITNIDFTGKKNIDKFSISLTNNINVYKIDLIKDLKNNINGISIISQGSENNSLISYSKSNYNERVTILDEIPNSATSINVDKFLKIFTFKSDELCTEELNINLKNELEIDKIKLWALNLNKEYIINILNIIKNETNLYSITKDNFSIINSIYDILNNNVESEEIENIFSKYKYNCQETNKTYKFINKSLTLKKK